jgi:G6PDH family F420-dependent oxidoreductase
MYPGRYWLGIGAGEALNEHFAATYWPDPSERSARLFEAIELIKAYFASGLDGREVRHRGVYYKTNPLRLWTTPEVPPPVIVAASGPKNARRAGEVGDGLITAGADLSKLQMLCEEFDQGVIASGRNPADLSKMLIQHVSWAPSYELAAAEAVRWWPNGGMNFPKGSLTSPFEIEKIAELIEPKHFKNRVLISADLAEHTEHLRSLFRLGFNHIYLHNVGTPQREWIDLFSTSVLPRLMT